MASEGFPLKKIVAGEKSGAQRAALETASILKLETGGCVSLKFMTESEENRELCKLYNLQQASAQTLCHASATDSFILCAMRNVDDSDATLVFRVHFCLETDCTIGYCLTGKWTRHWISDISCPDTMRHRQVLIIDRSVDIYSDASSVASDLWVNDANAVREFIRKHNVKTLNVVGHQQCKEVYPEWELRVKNFLIFALGKQF